MTSKGQKGFSTVEFAIVAAVLLTVILGVIDISRLFFSVAALSEGTRRGARMAAVCPVNDPAIALAAVFGGSGDSPIVGGLRTDHVDVDYLDESGAPIPDPSPGAGFKAIEYVRVRLNGGFQLRSVIPGFSRLIPLPDFEATLPRESLGIPREGAVVSC